MRTITALVSVLVASSLVGCGAAPVGPSGASAEGATASAPARASDGSVERAVRLRAAPGQRASGVVALASDNARTLAFVADEEGHAIVAFDVDARRVLATTELAGAPAQVMILEDGRLVVALRDVGRVALLEAAHGVAAPLVTRGEVAVAAEPIALAASADGAHLFVASGWSHRFTALRTSDLARAWDIDLPREPRAVVLDERGETAFVSHAAGSQISAIDLEWHGVTAIDLHRDAVPRRWGDGDVREAGQGYALVHAMIRPRPEEPARGVLFAPGVSIEPGQGVFTTEVYGPPQGAPVLPAVHVIDEAAARLTVRSSRTTDVAVERRCNLPRAAALRGASLFVACLGVDAVVELDARASDPANLELRRFAVPSGPTGLAIDGDHDRAIVWSAFAHRLSVLALDARAPHVPVAVVDAPARATWLAGRIARGRDLFHTTRDPRISGDGRACASCHVDGREDGIVWATPAGPRQTIMLAGRVEGSAPFGWTGARRDLAGHIRDTWHRLGGRGVFSPADKDDLDALAAYVASMKPPPRAELAQNAALVARGREVFEAPAQGCSSCHPGGHTDGASHDVGSDPFHRPFDTPSLRFVGGTAPYFHDGRYANLGELLRGSEGSMGHTAHLSEEDRRALVAYLETL